MRLYISNNRLTIYFKQVVNTGEVDKLYSLLSEDFQLCILDFRRTSYIHYKDARRIMACCSIMKRRGIKIIFRNMSLYIRNILNFSKDFIDFPALDRYFKNAKIS